MLQYWPQIAVIVLLSVRFLYKLFSDFKPYFESKKHPLEKTIAFIVYASFHVFLLSVFVFLLAMGGFFK